jgi:hypothetical protein
VGIYITLKNPEFEDSITNLLESVIYIKNLLLENKTIEFEKLTIWKDGPNVAFGERIDVTEDNKELMASFSNVGTLHKRLSFLGLSKLTSKKVHKDYTIPKFLGGSVPFNSHIIGLNAFAIQLDGKLLLSNNHIPCYLKALFNTGFEQDYGNIYLETFSHSGNDFLDFILKKPADYEKIIFLMKKIASSKFVNPLKIIIGEDQVNNMYSVGSIFFWYKEVQDYFTDIDSFIGAINDTGKSEGTYLLSQLGISQLYDAEILDRFDEFKRIYKLENLRESYSKNKEMIDFLVKTAKKIKMPISVKHSFMGYSEGCNPRDSGLLVGETIKIVEKILSKTLQREKDIKK